MACDTILSINQTRAERLKQIMAALKRLEQQLATGKVAVGIGPNGAIVFPQWGDRDGVSDVCAYRTLSSMGSQALARAVQQAEMMTGRKVNAQVIATGFHSHDGGKTWGKH